MDSFPLHSLPLIPVSCIVRVSSDVLRLSFPFLSKYHTALLVVTFVATDPDSSDELVLNRSNVLAASVSVPLASGSILGELLVSYVLWNFVAWSIDSYAVVRGCVVSTVRS